MSRYRVERTYGPLVAGDVIAGGPNAELMVRQGILKEVSDDTPLTNPPAEEERPVTAPARAPRQQSTVATK
jgi:hypothetical protein